MYAFYKMYSRPEHEEIFFYYHLGFLLLFRVMRSVFLVWLTVVLEQTGFEFHPISSFVY